MKRFLLILGAIVLISCLCVACHGETETEVPNSSDGTEQTSSRDTTGTEPPVTDEEDRKEARIKALQALILADRERAKEIGNATVSAYAAPAFGGVYRLSETYNLTSKKANGSASVWHYTSYFAMLSRLLEMAEPGSKEAEDLLKTYNTVYEGFKYYEGTATHITYLATVDITMYGVHRAAVKGGARVDGVQAVYDDQMWIIRENIYAYRITGDAKYLDEAIRLTGICINGWDYTINKETKKEFGGIPWGPGYSSKHTCSNGPLIMPLVEIYEILKEQGDKNADFYLEWAKKIYDYSRETFENANHTYGDNVGYDRVVRGSGDSAHYETLRAGGMDAKTYTYNTGSMISGACALYRVTGDTAYLKQAKQSVAAAYKSFLSSPIRDGNKMVYFYPNDTETTWFNLVLLQGFMDYYEIDPDHEEKYIQSFQDTMDYAYKTHLKNGFLPRDYRNGWNKDLNFDVNKNVMDQASASQIYAMLAIWQESRLATLQAIGNE